MWRLFLLVVMALLSAMVTLLYLSLNTPVSPGQFEVPPGTSLFQVSSKLHSEGILNSSERIFRYYALATLHQGHVKAGEYNIESGIPAYELLAVLRQGKVVQHEITFPEGWTTRQWLDHMAGFADIQMTLAGMDGETFKRELSISGPVEGAFYPDTYQYTRNTADRVLLRTAHKRQQQMLLAEWQNRTDSAAVHSMGEAMVLASMVEKETGFEPDRPLIGSVFNNRLNAGMKLQSDPTVIYGLEDFDGNLTRRDLTRDHAFNTYTRHGLPPEPICNPGVASIRAVLQPVASPYLYFVAKGNGQSHFSVSLEEHNAAVVRFQKAGRVHNYRSTPE